MANLTYNAVTNFNATGVPEYPGNVWANDTRGRPTTKIPQIFKVHQPVLIWYHNDGCWHTGKVVRFRSTEKDGLYEVEFVAGGPRIRDWYNPSCGYIEDDTPDARDHIRARGWTLVV